VTGPSGIDPRRSGSSGASARFARPTGDLRDLDVAEGVFLGGGSTADTRRLLFASLVYLSVLLAVMAVDKLAS